MPMDKYTGAAMGGGNPPGGYSKGYVNDPGASQGHFVNDKSYRGDMHEGPIMESPPNISNQPQENRTWGLDENSMNGSFESKKYSKDYGDGEAKAGKGQAMYSSHNEG